MRPMIPYVAVVAVFSVLVCTLALLYRTTLPCTLALVSSLKGKQGGKAPVNNWWRWWWWQLFAIGVSLWLPHDLLEHCDRMAALLATGIKYTQTRCAICRRFLCPTVFMCWSHLLNSQGLETSEVKGTGLTVSRAGSGALKSLLQTRIN